MNEIIEILSTYKHVIADFDGTLVRLPIDWPTTIERINDVLRPLRVEISNVWELTTKYATIYYKNKEKIDAILKEAEREVVEKEKWETINSWLWSYLAKHEFAINSNNMHSTIEEICSKEFLFPLMIVGRDDVSYPKPYPEGVKKILAEMGWDKGETIFIGDSRWDKLTAEMVEMDYIDVEGRDYATVY